VVIYVLIQLRDEWHLRVRQGHVRVGWRDLEAREAIERPGARRGAGVHRVEQEKERLLDTRDGGNPSRPPSPKDLATRSLMSRKSVVFGLFRLVITWILPICSTIKSRLLSPADSPGPTGLSKRSPGTRQCGVLVWFQRERQGGILPRVPVRRQNPLQGSGFDQAKREKKEDPAIVHAAINTD